MYNIFTVTNLEYAPFTDILISSIQENCDLNNINSIYILDTGIDETYKHYFSSKKKVRILESKIKASFDGVNTHSWKQVVDLKTYHLLKLLKDEKLFFPTIMIDSDVCIIKEISTIINNDYDIQYTKKLLPYFRGDGIFLDAIASFLIINSKQVGIQFLEEWIKNMKDLNLNNVKYPHETPALNITVKQQKNIKIESLDELVVCADRTVFPETLGIHFKSNGPAGSSPIENFETRISNLRTFVEPINFLEYINYNLYLRWKQNFLKQRPLQYLCEKHNSDKGKAHSYIPLYESVFKDIHLEKLNILEIGILFGSSLLMWEGYFEKSNIYGIDNFSHKDGQLFHKYKPLVKSDVLKKLKPYKRIFPLVFDSEDISMIKNKLKNLKFRIIIDDACHTFENQLSNLKNYFPYLEEKGVYICEDILNQKNAIKLKEFAEKNFLNIKASVIEFNVKFRPDDRILLIQKLKN